MEGLNSLSDTLSDTVTLTYGNRHQIPERYCDREFQTSKPLQRTCLSSSSVAEVKPAYCVPANISVHDIIVKIEP